VAQELRVDGGGSAVTGLTGVRLKPDSTDDVADGPVTTRPPAPRVRRGAEPRGLIIALALGAIIWAIPVPAGVEPRGWHLLAIFVATVVGIIVRPLPMGAVAMIGMAAALLTGTLDDEEVLLGFGRDAVWLVLSAFLLAGTVIRTGLGRRIAFLFMALVGHRTLGLAYALAATDLVLAPFVPSHTARSGGIVFPVFQSIARSAFDPLGTGGDRRTPAFLTLVTYFSTCVTSAMFLTAMAGNPLTAELAAAQGVRITWGLWALAALVPGLLSLILVPLVIYTIHPPDVRHSPGARAFARRELEVLGPMQRDERILVGVFAVLLVLWSFGSQIGLSSAAAAFAALAVLFLTGVLAWEHVSHEHEAWTTFVWFAVLLMMATELAELGVTKWFSEVVTAGIGSVGWVQGFVLLCLAYFYSHYLFASNTAHITAMYAPFLVVALALGTPPFLAAIVLGFFSNLFGTLTHYAAACAPVYFGAGYVPVATWWKLGALTSVVNITIWLGVGSVWWKVLGLW
jgi:DASS family divalent anion:Na+ symporter